VFCIAGAAVFHCSVLQVFVLAWCPESPVWLQGIGNEDAADTACLKLWGVHALVPEPDYEADLDHVAASSAAAAAATAAASAGGGGGLQQALLLSGSTGTSSNSSIVLGLAGASSPSRRLQQPVVTSAAMAWDSPRYVAAGGFAAAAAGGWDSSSSYGMGPGLRSVSSDMGWGEEGGGGIAGGFRRQGQGSRTAGGWDCLLERQYRWMMLLALGLPLLQQASGINTVVYYSSQVRGWNGRAYWCWYRNRVCHSDTADKCFLFGAVACCACLSCCTLITLSKPLSKEPQSHKEPRPRALAAGRAVLTCKLHATALECEAAGRAEAVELINPVSAAMERQGWYESCWKTLFEHSRDRSVFNRSVVGWMCCRCLLLLDCSRQ
jgi:hypothetical protein